MKNFQITITGDYVTIRSVEQIVNSDAVIGSPSYLDGAGYVQLTLVDCPDSYTTASVRKVFEPHFRNETIDVAEFQ